MLNRTADAANIPYWAARFSDVASDHWAYADISEASAGHRYERDASGLEIWTEEMK
jgi:hypothetical protein